MSDEPWLKDAPVAGRIPAPAAASNPWDNDKPVADKPNIAGLLRPTGQVHDGDTFRLDTGANARLLGVDAFELAQTGRSPSGVPVQLGVQARSALSPFAQPSATVTPTGASTYGRQVVTLDRGGDAGTALLDQGLALAGPQYLKDNPARLSAYMEAERLARLNHRGAWANTFQTPSSYRHGGAEPWARPSDDPVKPGEGGQAYFWDDPTPFQGLRKDIASGYSAIFQDMNSKPDDLLAYAKANGFEIDPADTRKRYAMRDKAKTAGGDINYVDKPRVLTDQGDGGFGSFMRGVGDPINMLDEMGAVVDSLGGTSGRENVWNSDRRFGDVLSNNLDQNRSILGHDDAEHPYARMGGQLASGLVLPGASIEGVGFGAARAAMRSGATRMGAEAAGKAAVRNRLIAVGAAEGTAAGVGGGEGTQGRVVGGLESGLLGAGIGAVAGTAGRAAVDRTAGWLAARRAGRAAAGTQPDVGQFGPIHWNLANDYPAALERLKADGTGEVPGAINHPELGPIDLVWGDGAYGLSKIVQRHPEVVDDLPRIVEGLPVLQTPEQVGNNRFVLGNDQHRAVISPDFDGETKRWLVTAYEKGTTPGEQTSRRAPLMPDGGSTGSGAGDDLGAGGVPGNTQAPVAMSSDVETPTLVGPRSPDRIDVNAGARPLAGSPLPFERLQAAERIQPGDVLPLPSSSIDGVEEAARIEQGRFTPVRAPNERETLTAQTVASRATGAPIARRGPADLVTWLRSAGGVRDEGGNLAHSGISNAPRTGMPFAGREAQIGPLVSSKGMSLDEAARAAWESGYFPGHAERPTINEFLNAVTDTHAGSRRAFRPDDLAEVDAHDAAQSERLAIERAAQAGAPATRDNSQPASLADLDANSAPVHAYEEWGENAPNLAGNVRLDKLDSPQAIKRALVATHQRVGGFDAATRGRITHAETENLARDLGMSADDLLARRKGQAFNAEEALAARQILARSATELVNMARTIARTEVPGDEMEAGFKRAWLRHAAIQEQVAGMTAEAGRLLSSMRMTADGRAVAGRALPSLGDIAGGTARLKDAADRIVDLQDAGVGPGGINKFAVDALKPRFRDKLIELYYNSLLSGPQTHATNILSNTLTALGQLPEHALAAGIGGARRAAGGKNADRVLFSELGARAVGLLQGANEGMRLAARAFRTGEPADAVTKVEQASQKAISGVKGSILRTPTRALMAEDEFAKGMARRMELAGLAARQAGTEGLSGKAARTRAAELLANPSDDMVAKAFDYARYVTFQRPLGGVGQKISGITEEWPLLKLILPFTRTPTNILKYALERSPAAPFLKEWRRDIAAGGARADLAMAKVAAGSGVGALIVSLAAQGHITGGGPADDNARRLLLADGWQPYSLKIGDRYYSYSRLDPYASTLGTAADLVELRSHMTDRQQEHTAALVTTAVAHNLANKTWLSGLSGALEAFNDPDRFMPGWQARMAGSLVIPAGAAQLARTIDPVMRDARSPMDAIRARIPGLSAGLPAKRDIFGQPIATEGLGPDMLSPLRTGTAKNDPTAAALLSAGVGISQLQRFYTRDHKRVEWEPWQYDRMQEDVGRRAKPQLDALVASPYWGWIDDDQRQEEVGSVMKTARTEAKAAILSELSKGEQTRGPVAKALAGAR